MMLLVTMIAGAETSTKTIYVYAKGWGNLTGCKVAAYGWSPTQIFTDMQKDEVYPPCYKIEVENERSTLIFCKLDANAENNWEEVKTFPDVRQRIPEQSVLVMAVDASDEDGIAFIDEVHGDPGKGFARSLETFVSEIAVDELDVAHQ